MNEEDEENRKNGEDEMKMMLARTTGMEGGKGINGDWGGGGGGDYGAVEGTSKPLVVRGCISSCHCSMAADCPIIKPSLLFTVAAAAGDDHTTSFARNRRSPSNCIVEVLHIMGFCCGQTLQLQVINVTCGNCNLATQGGSTMSQ